MGLKLKIVPAIVIDPSPGDVSINGITLDSSIQLTTPDDLLFHNGHLIVDRNANGISSVKYVDDVDPSIRDTLSFFAGVSGIEIHEDLLYVNVANETIYAIDVNQSTGDLTVCASTSPLPAESISWASMASTQDRLVIVGGNKQVYSFSTDVSGALTYDTSVDAFQADGYLSSIAGNGRHNFLAWQVWDYNGGTFQYESTTLYEVEVSAGYIGTKDTWNKTDWPIAANSGYLYCPDQSLERATIKISTQPWMYVVSYTDNGFGIPETYSPSAPVVSNTDGVAMHAESEVLVSPGSDFFADPGFVLWENPSVITETEPVVEEYIGGTLHYDNGMAFIDSSGYKFAASDTAGGEIVNYNIDVSITGGGGGSSSSASSLNIIPGTADSAEVLDFDGTHTINEMSLASVDIEGDKKVTFKLWLDASTGFSYRTGIISFKSTIAENSDRLEVSLTGGDMYVGGYGYSSPTFLIGDNTGQILNCEVNKSSNSIDSFKINEITQTPNGSETYGSFASTWYIGYASNELINGTVWDIKIYDTSSGEPGTLTHHWLGYPAGNTDAAWEDQIGSFDGSISGESPTTRDITGGGSTSTGGSKLLLD